MTDLIDMTQDRPSSKGRDAGDWANAWTANAAHLAANGLYDPRAGHDARGDACGMVA